MVALCGLLGLACGRSDLDNGGLSLGDDAGDASGGDDGSAGDGDDASAIDSAPTQDGAPDSSPVDVAACGPITCGTGCCDFLGRCQPGGAASACGASGQACVDCTAQGPLACGGGQCVKVPPRCSASCTGCCDANGGCQAGFVDSQCGQNGASCVDCTRLGRPFTCDVNASPRACTSQQAQCPSPYSACPAGLETPAPPKLAACAPGDLQNAAAACTGGAHTSSCQSFFQFERSRSAACAACLMQFDFDFAERQGVFACVAPFVGASCNHEAACTLNCVDTSCAQCASPSSATQCQRQVSGAQCASYLRGSQCIRQGFAGTGSFCSPGRYGSNFGRWLQGVGTQYCGN